MNVSGGGVCVQPVVVVRTVQLARPNDTCRRSRLSPSSFTPSLLWSALAELGASSTPRRERLRPQASVTPVCIACPAREASDPQARRCGKALRTWQVEGHKGILPTYLAQRRKMRSGVCGALGRRNRIKPSCGSPTWSGLQSMPSCVRSGLRSRSLVDVLVEHSAHGLHPQ